MDVEYVVRGGLRIEVERDPLRAGWWRARVVRDARRGPVAPAPWTPGRSYTKAVSGAVNAWSMPWERYRRRNGSRLPGARY